MFDPRCGEIGEPERHIIIEPIEEPAYEPIPEHVPEREPAST